MLCDMYGVRRVSQAGVVAVKAGTPILYYRADQSSKSITDSSYDKRIYNVYDNYYLVDLEKLTTDGAKSDPPDPHTFREGNGLDKFYEFDHEGGITDSKVINVDWPHNSDSKILISS